MCEKVVDIGSLNGRRGEVCVGLRKGMVDVCCLWEVRWRGYGFRLLEMY